MPDPNIRATKAQQAVEGHARRSGNGSDIGVDLRSLIIDLLADLRFLCDREALDFSECDRMAYSHYCAEK